MICEVCRAPPCGLFYTQSYRKHPKEIRNQHSVAFCSKRCQDIFTEKNNKDTFMRRTDLEQQATQMMLPVLWQAAGGIGLSEGLACCTQQQALTFITLILDSYHQTLRELYKDEVPF